MLADKGVISLPDTPAENTPAELKAKFDELSREVIIPQFNTLMDLLDAGTTEEGEALDEITAKINANTSNIEGLENSKQDKLTAIEPLSIEVNEEEGTTEIKVDLSDYVTKDEAYDSATKTWVEEQGYAKDSDIPEWAKAGEKPTYTAEEVGALPDTTVIPDISGKQDKLIAGDNITIKGNVISAEGGGTNVSVEPIVTVGTNIADITIDGVTTQLYAPTGGGGGGGVSSYGELPDKPQINGVTLNGNKSLDELGIIIPSLEGYATESWVEEKNYLTEQDISSKADKAQFANGICILGDSNAQLYQAGNYIDNEFPNTPIQKLAVGGNKFANIGDGYSVLNQLSSISGSPDVFIIWCGNNDIAEWVNGRTTIIGHPNWSSYNKLNYDISTSFGALEYLLATIRENYPSAKILGVLRTYTTTRAYQRSNFFWHIVNKIYQKWNCPVLDLQKTANITEYIASSKSANMSDDVHYNDSALRYINTKIVGELSTGCNGVTEIDNNVYYSENNDVAGNKIKNAIYILGKVLPKDNGNKVTYNSNILCWNSNDGAGSQLQIISSYTQNESGSFLCISPINRGGFLNTPIMSVNWEWFGTEDVSAINYTCSYVDTSPIKVNSETDMNTLMQHGKYSIDSTFVKANKPPSAPATNALVEVTMCGYTNDVTEASTILQKYIAFNAGVPAVWYRRYFNGWSKWFKYSGTIDE